MKKTHKLTVVQIKDDETYEVTKKLLEIDDGKITRHKTGNKHTVTKDKLELLGVDPKVVERLERGDK